MHMISMVWFFYQNIGAQEFMEKQCDAISINLKQVHMAYRKSFAFGELLINNSELVVSECYSV